MDRSTITVGPAMDMPIMHDSDRYDFVRDIGSGNFGVARLMRDKHTKELVAVKYIERGDKVNAVLLIYSYFFSALCELLELNLSLSFSFFGDGCSPWVFLASIATVTYGCLFCSTFNHWVLSRLFFLLNSTQISCDWCFSFLSVIWEFEISQFGFWILDFGFCLPITQLSFSFF